MDKKNLRERNCISLIKITSWIIIATLKDPFKLNVNKSSYWDLMMTLSAPVAE